MTSSRFGPKQRPYDIKHRRPAWEPAPSPRDTSPRRRDPQSGHSPLFQHVVEDAMRRSNELHRSLIERNEAALRADQWQRRTGKAPDFNPERSKLILDALVASQGAPESFTEKVLEGLLRQYDADASKASKASPDEKVPEDVSSHHDAGAAKAVDVNLDGVLEDFLRQYETGASKAEADLEGLVEDFVRQYNDDPSYGGGLHGSPVGPDVAVPFDPGPDDPGFDAVPPFDSGFGTDPYGPVQPGPGFGDNPYAPMPPLDPGFGGNPYAPGPLDPGYADPGFSGGQPGGGYPGPPGPAFG